MIFATIGTQLPFDRLIEMLDRIAPLLDEEVVAQVNHSTYQARNIKTVEFLSPDAFAELFGQARLIVAHAGMGTILSALQQGKPIIIFPRSAALGEHRNEHQKATAAKMQEAGWCHVANDESELRTLLTDSDLRPLRAIGDYASQSLIQSLAEFIDRP